MVESILSLNSQASDLGEVNIFEESYRKYIQSDKKLNLAKIYNKNSRILGNKTNITINKDIKELENYEGIFKQHM